MKGKITIVISSLLLLQVCVFLSCGNKNDKIVELYDRLDSLQMENQQKDADIRDMNLFVEVLANGLDSIAKQEEMLFYTNKGKEGTIIDRKQLKDNLERFEELLNSQKQRIAKLTDSLKANGTRLAQIERLVDYLNQQIEEKDGVIKSLRAELNSKNTDITHLRKRVENLSESNKQLTEKVGKQVEALKVQNKVINECYVIIGSKKELRNMGVISTGFLKKTTVNPNALQHGNFTKVDISKIEDIPVNSSNPKILSHMPVSSYQIVKTGSGNSVIRIIDPTLFWSVSNFLIIQSN